MNVSVPVLMYHSVCHLTASPGFSAYRVSPAMFESHLVHLLSTGYRIVAAADVAALDRREKAVAITFDDAYVDFERYVVPVLARYQAPASLFVPTGFVGGRARWLSPLPEKGEQILDWSALRDIAACGLVDIGAHSHTHAELDRTDRARIEAELRLPRLILEDNLQQPVPSFAYPFGYASRRVHRLARDAGYATAWSVGERQVSAADSLWALPRLSVRADTDVEDLKLLLASSATAGVRAVSGAKTTAWRVRRQLSRKTPASVEMSWSDRDGVRWSS